MRVSESLQALALILATAACGAAPLPGQTAAATTTATSAGALTGDWQCPARANVIPGYDHTLTYSVGFYKVCTSASNSSLLRVKGTTQSSSTVCLFPAQISDQGLIQPKRATNGLPEMICKNLSAATADGLDLQIENLQFNYLYVAEGQYAQQMQVYLGSGNPQYAPSFYSEGRIRN